MVHLGDLDGGGDLGDGALGLEGLLASPDGTLVVRREATGTDPVALGVVVGAAVRSAFDG